MAVSPSACVTCRGGSAAEQGSAACTQCGIGTYALSNAKNCTDCPMGSWAAVSSTVCTTCIAGTYSTTPIAAASQCRQCPIGFYCPGGTQAIMCPIGTYAIVGGFTSQAQCVSCPANYFCPSTYLKAACPSGTSSPMGSTSQLACACGAGYSCVYNRVVEAVISLNMSFAQFQTQEVQQAFVAAVASAANVAANKVFITDFRASPANRRLLGDTKHVVGVGIKDAERITDLDKHMIRQNLPPTLSHVWIAPHVAVVTAAVEKKTQR